jgi:hypothetical protein
MSSKNRNQKTGYLDIPPGGTVVRLTSADTKPTSSGQSATSEKGLPSWRVNQMRRSRYSQTDPLITSIIDDMYECMKGNIDFFDECAAYELIHERLVEAGYRIEVRDSEDG